MLYFDRIDGSEGIDVSKTTTSREFIICYYRYFLEINFSFQSKVCSGCQDILKISTNLNHIAILNIRGVDYRCIINGSYKVKL